MELSAGVKSRRIGDEKSAYDHDDEPFGSGRAAGPCSDQRRNKPARPFGERQIQRTTAWAKNAMRLPDQKIQDLAAISRPPRSSALEHGHVGGLSRLTDTELGTIAGAKIMGN